MTDPMEHREFYEVDLSEGWVRVESYPEGVAEKILAGRLDEENKTGCRTRLVRFSPGADTREAVTHDYWEEVFVLSGDLLVGEAREAFGPNTHAFRPPGASHGPFRSEGGCILFEIHRY